jgi:hypothetical protein
MVYGASAINDFIEPVAIHVALTEAVTTLALISTIGFSVFSGSGGIRIEIPPLGQFSASPIKSPEA